MSDKIEVHFPDGDVMTCENIMAVAQKEDGRNVEIIKFSNNREVKYKELIEATNHLSSIITDLTFFALKPFEEDK